MEFKDKKVIARLKEARWYEGRNIQDELSFNYEDSPNFVKEFHYKYANLIIKRVDDPRMKGEAELHIFSDVEQEFLKGEQDYPYYQGIIGKRLYPLGVYLPDAYNVCCDADGRVYKIGEYCFSVGKNLYEGIENILLMNTLQSLQLDEDTGKWWNMEAEYVELPTLE